ncbi:DUF1778 domain-containing protein [Symbioplanes lichenis]|uniref:type II toxin-antitoxin system TacA family antitoxin n=1 Tax=Symbioplanes lichenis TaxID=1629072 RepID=UPI0027399BCB|nr:DUF1778 domain-containing protein [Actinoplanes lichenis]
MSATDPASQQSAVSPPSRTERINLRATAGDAALIRQAASAKRMTVTEFMLGASIEEARRVLNEDHRLEVLGEVYDRLAAEIKEPAEVVDAMVEMIKRPRRLQQPVIEG